jgi:hypothetical protein
MKFVLDALPKDRDVPYGTIVNTLTEVLTTTLHGEPNSHTILAGCLNSGRENPTAYIHLYAKIIEWRRGHALPNLEVQGLSSGSEPQDRDS